MSKMEEEARGLESKLADLAATDTQQATGILVQRNKVHHRPVVLTEPYALPLPALVRAETVRGEAVLALAG